MDAMGWVRPNKSNKKSKWDDFDAMAELFKRIRFTKSPKVVNLTNELKMPALLDEMYNWCQVEDKDLYLFYYLIKHKDDSTIVFTNSITCLKRLSNLLNVLKVKHSILFSKMQQK